MDARQTHQVLSYTGGARFAIAFYCPKNSTKLPPHALSTLRRLGYPVAWWASERCWQQALWCDLLANKPDECAQALNLLLDDKPDKCAPNVNLLLEDKPDECAQNVNLLLDDKQDVPTAWNWPEGLDEEGGLVTATAEPQSSASGPPEGEHAMEQGQSAEQDVVLDDEPLPTGDVGGLQEHEIEVPNKGQQSALLRMHVNLGHPDLHSFLRSLRIGGVRRSVRAWVRFRFRCPSCAAWRPRLQRRPAHIGDVHRFNMAVALDNFHIEVPNVGKKTVLHSICLGTRYQTARVVADGVTPTSEAVLSAFIDSWTALFGWPQAILVDAGVEFRQVFRDTLEHHGVYIGVINSQAPHENGICERAGGRLKELLHLSFEDAEPLSELDFKVALASVTAAHNRFYDRSGYTPAQRVFGQNPVYPEELLSDKNPDAEIMSIDGGISYSRSMEIRAAALRAFVSHSVKQRLTRAAAAKTKTQERFNVGEVVFILRQPRTGPPHRLGPGTIVMCSGGSAWVSAHGELYKASTMALRRATTSDCQGVELVNQLLPELVGQIPRNRRVRDLTGELPGDGQDQVLEPAAMLPPTPRLPGTPSAATRVRRMSIVSTAAPSGGGPEEPLGGVASQAGSESNMLPEVSDSRVVEGTTPEDGENVESAGREPHERSVRRRLDPMVEAQVRRIEGDAEMHMFQYQRVSDWYTDSDANFPLSEGCAVFCPEHGGGNFVVTRKASDELDPNSISPADWPAFEQAIKKEGAKMLNEFRGLEVLSLEESDRVRQTHGDRILPSRLHLRWKVESTSTGTKKSAKARWILVGFHDPDVLSLDGAAPTPQLTSLNVVLQVLAGLQFEAYAGDFATAFLQGDETRRLLWVTAPAHCEVLGLDKRQLLRVRKEVYGSVAAPQRWRQSLVKALTSLDWVQSLVDPCVFTLPGELSSQDEVAVREQGLNPVAMHDDSEFLIPPSCLPSDNSKCFVPIRGIVVVLVDDIIEGGDSAHRERIAKLQQRFSLGQHLSLKKKGGTLFNGRRVEQLPDCSFRVSMKDFITTRLQAVKVPRERKKNLDAPVSEDERSVLRTVLMKLLWIARQCRPEIQGSCSIIASRIPNATVGELVELGK
eukprot:1069486-Amphidinium_carterae.1